MEQVATHPVSCCLPASYVALVCAVPPRATVVLRFTYPPHGSVRWCSTTHDHAQARTAGQHHVVLVAVVQVTAAAVAGLRGRHTYTGPRGNALRTDKVRRDTIQCITAAVTVADSKGVTPGKPGGRKDE